MEKKPVIITEKIGIGISACCMGCPVRYNGKGWDMLKNLGREKNDFKWCPVCPECMAGFGVPREPIHLSDGDGTMVWANKATVTNRKGFDVTNSLKVGAKICLEALERSKAVAYVYMEGSPTCGVYKTSLKKQNRGNPPGVFGSMLQEKGFFLIPSGDMQNPLKWWDWRRRLLAFYWVKNFKLNNTKDIYELWYYVKFICQELDNEWARDTGNKLAKIEGKPEKDFTENLRKDIMDLLRKPSVTKKITNSLWKNYSHYRKESGKNVDEVNSPEFTQNITNITKELILLERKSIDDNILFATSPILFRG